VAPAAVAAVRCAAPDSGGFPTVPAIARSATRAFRPGAHSQIANAMPQPVPAGERYAGM
jgi:hypothetical protein